MANMGLEEAKQIQIEAKSGGRICEHCGQEFKSGKALGGHMRIHNLKPKENSSSIGSTYKKFLKLANTLKLKKDQEKQVPIQNPDIGQKSVDCSICFKSFPSMKAMYGHMRCHPERYWRGIQPPTPFAGVGDADADADDRVVVSAAAGGADTLSASNQVSDLIGLLDSWPSTSKRGRSAAASKPSFLESKEFRECVENLVYLSRAKILDDGYPEKINFKSPSSDDGTETHKPKLTPESKGNVLEKFADDCVQYSYPPNLKDEDESGIKITQDLKQPKHSQRFDEKTINSKTNISNRKKKMKLEGPEFNKQSIKKQQSSIAGSSGKFATEEVKIYTCVFCQKTFSNHYGLGGHMSKHNKDRNIITPSFIDQDSSAAATILEENHPNPSPIQKKKRKKTEESRLGSSKKIDMGKKSNKKCRRTTDTLATEELPVRDATCISAIHKNNKLDIDLNETPPPEADEEAAGGGSGLATSSSSDH